MTLARVENINSKILRQCREQIGLAIDDVRKKIPSIEDLEDGKKSPTFGQLNKLAELYRVPRWVFISKSLPAQYQIEEKVPAFRQFAESQLRLSSDYKVRSIATEVERMREFILELREDMDEPITSFAPPDYTDFPNPSTLAQKVRTWLGTEGNHEFPDWKKKLEEQNVLIFLTSKYPGRFYAGKSTFRGLSLYHPILPIIIINNSDARKAQSFTLFHELGHLLRREAALDDWEQADPKSEKWCDEFAGSVLMPKDQLQKAVQDNGVEDLDSIKKTAQHFKVSSYACLVRSRQLNIIDQPTYKEFQEQLDSEYKTAQRILKEKSSFFSRKRSKEVLDQYGHIYTRTIFQAYYNRDIGLHKLCQLFDLKRVSDVWELKKRL